MIGPPLGKHALLQMVLFFPFVLIFSTCFSMPLTHSHSGDRIDDSRGTSFNFPTIGSQVIEVVRRSPRLETIAAEPDNFVSLFEGDTVPLSSEDVLPTAFINKLSSSPTTQPVTPTYSCVIVYPNGTEQATSGPLTINLGRRLFTLHTSVLVAITGVPLGVVLISIVVILRWHARRKKIQKMIETIDAFDTTQRSPSASTDLVGRPTRDIAEEEDVVLDISPARVNRQILRVDTDLKKPLTGQTLPSDIPFYLVSSPADSPVCPNCGSASSGGSNNPNSHGLFAPPIAPPPSYQLRPDRYTQFEFWKTGASSRPPLLPQDFRRAKSIKN